MKINTGLLLQLLGDLEAALYSHQVKVLSPLEMAPSGKRSWGVEINLYSAQKLL